MRDAAKAIIASIKKFAKDLSDEEVLSLYKKVKEKLNSQGKDEDQTLDGKTHGEEPMGSENNSLIKPIDTPEAPVTETPAPEVAPEDENVDESIDELLTSLGLDEPSEDSPELPVENPTTEPTQNEKPNSDTIVEPKEEPKPLKEPVKETEDLSEVVPEAEPKEASSVKVPDDAQVSDDDFIGELFNSLDLEESPEPTPVKKIMVHPPVEVPAPPADPFSPDKFVTAGRGFQLNRKDTDLMADDATGPKYEDPKVKPPRMDCRRPNGIRWKKNESDRDPDVDNDPDLK